MQHWLGLSAGASCSTIANPVSRRPLCQLALVPVHVAGRGVVSYPGCPMHLFFALSYGHVVRGKGWDSLQALLIASLLASIEFALSIACAVPWR